MIFRRQTYDIVIIVVKLNSGVVTNLLRTVTTAHLYNLYIIFYISYIKNLNFFTVRFKKKVKSPFLIATF